MFSTWLKSVIDDVIEAGTELANDIQQSIEEKKTRFDRPEDNNEDASTVETLPLPPTQRSQRQRSQSQNGRESFDESPHSARESKKNIFEGATLLQIGVTPLLTEYVVNLCQHPETWISFPVEEVLRQKAERSEEHGGPPQRGGVFSDEDYQLTDKQEAHAKAVLDLIPELNSLRYSLVPRQLSDSRFWQIYFLLVSNKFRLTDSDESFRMPLKTDTSLLANTFYLNYEQQMTTKGSKPFSFLREGSTTVHLSHPPALLDAQGTEPVHWWHSHSTGSRSPTYENTLTDPTHGTQGVTANWGSVDPAALKQDRPKVLKLLLRGGVPDIYRHKAWRAAPSSSICNDLPSTAAVTPRGGNPKKKAAPQPRPVQTYRDILEEIFGDEIPLSCNPIPTFNGNTSFHQHHYLSEQGIAIVRRLLIILAFKKPQLHSAPILPDLLALLVSFMAEDEAYETASLLIDESTERCHYLPMGNRHTELFGLTFVRLLQQHVPKVYQLAESLELDCKKIFVQWSTSLFVGVLPYQTVLRVVDCVLYEGSTVLYRVALALFSQCEAALLKCHTQKEWESALLEHAQQQVLADPLLLAAWKHKIKHEHLMEIYNALVLHEGSLQEVDEKEMEIVSLPTVRESSDIIGLEQFETLWRWIPQRYRLRNLTRIFHSNEDGFNLSTLVSHCEDISPTILLIKTRKQMVWMLPLTPK